METASLSSTELEETERRLVAELDRRKAEVRLKYYSPYVPQSKLHAAGKTHRERLYLGGNRTGKSLCGAAETAMHLTGRYPSWWQGRTFDKPVRVWAAGVTGETTRDVVQDRLIGPPFREAEWGTGMLPKDAIAGTVTARGIPGALDTVTVRHASGGNSSLQFKSYERGREKWQGVALDVLFFDEEPDVDIYMEGLTRTNETGGITYITATPMQGMSQVVKRFLIGD